MKTSQFKEAAKITYLRNLSVNNDDIGSKVRFKNPNTLEEAIGYALCELN